MAENRAKQLNQAANVTLSPCQREWIPIAGRCISEYRSLGLHDGKGAEGERLVEPQCAEAL